MSESINIDRSSSKSEKYEQLIPQILALVKGESNRVAVLATVSAVLHEAFDFFWTGFYLVEGSELIVGPFQGPVACLRIQKGKGVCGSAWENEQSIIVPDVNKYPGHIACSALSQSEIVIPMISDSGKVLGVLDIDSTELDAFDDVDRNNLEKLCIHLGKIL
ncbi:MAG TPA: diguanylate cyclase [Flavobacteriales bacterium]|nr:GAF domain-containing protein [Salibacteraceae bacterium]HAQ69574.1 diguanylate cyclase [Flavobacteriales bacterium]